MHGSPAVFDVRGCLVRSAVWICEDAGHTHLPPCSNCIEKASVMLADFFDGLPEQIKARQPDGFSATIRAASRGD